MSYALIHLKNAWQVDQAILNEQSRLVVIRWGLEDTIECKLQDQILFQIAEKCKNFVAIYAVEIDKVTDFNQMYQLDSPSTLMFFFRNQHIQVDTGTGNNNTLNFLLDDKQELIDLFEVIYRGVVKGKDLIISTTKFGEHR